ncbi:hypothetical protein HAX54_002989 [Datura stramonium]|uniref:Uncharacterized protein n=1 Tax=Datura stramonium TaxID=4076 RepID=A0ABS8T5R8_DATST|nr:hypothetical protein [Datura stramonium]
MAEVGKEIQVAVDVSQFDCTVVLSIGSNPNYDYIIKELMLANPNGVSLPGDRKWWKSQFWCPEMVKVLIVQQRSEIVAVEVAILVNPMKFLIVQQRNGAMGASALRHPSVITTISLVYGALPPGFSI